MKSGCRLGLDYWSETGCSDKHAYVDEFVEGKSVNVTGSTSTLVSIDNIPISDVLYEFDKEDGTVVWLEHNNTIYKGDNMIDSLDNPIQCEDNYTRIDLHPKVYNLNNNKNQSINFSDGTLIPINYNEVLPSISIHKPTNYEIENCEKIALTSKPDWDPYGKGGSFYKVEAHLNDIEAVMESFEGTDNISSKISCLSIGAMIFDTPVLHQSKNTTKDKRNYEDMYYTVGAVKAKSLPSLILERFIRIWDIELKNAIKTSDITTHQCIRSTGLLENWFKTDKYQLRYKQLSPKYGTFYVDYLKVGVKSERQFIGGIFYTNKLVSNKFFPLSNETSSETGHTLREFIELVDLPPTLHSDNHNNFKEGIFK